MNLVLHAVKTGHHHGSESQVRVRSRIRETNFDTTPLRVSDIRNAAGGRTVARRIRQVDWRFETRHQALVGIGARVGDRVQCLGMFNNTADVIQRKIRQAGVTVTGKQVFAALPDRLVHVHARAVVTDDWLRHEGCGFAVGLGYHLHRIFQDLVPVGTLHQLLEFGANFALARGRHFVVVYFDLNTLLLKRDTHRVTDVLQRIHRRNREIAALDWRTVTGVATFNVLVGRPRRFLGIDLDRATGHVHLPGHRIKNEELGLRTKVSGIAKTGRFQIRFATLGDGARIAVITLAVRRLDHVAADVQHRLIGERVKACRIRIRHQQHVRRFDTLPTGDRGTVKSVAIGKFIFGKLLGRNRDMLLLATRIRKTKVDKLDFVFFDHFHYIGYRHASLLAEC